MYPSTGQRAACVTDVPGTSPIPAESFAACPVTPALAAALTRFAAGNEADPLCRCQNTFNVTIATKTSALPSGYKGPRSDKTVKVTLAFGGVGGKLVTLVIAHKNRDGSWVAADTYCAARRGDTNPYRNRMTASPKACAPA